MKYVFVGDIHGKWEVVEEALQREGHKVFVGDFVDSFTRTTDDMEKCLSLVLDAIKKNEADAIFGNHELSYLMPNKHLCSGRTSSTAEMMKSWESNLWNSFKPFIKLPGNFLITHAGAHYTVYPAVKLERFNELSSPMHWIGWYRGGHSKVGGIFWCDFNKEFRPVTGINQVFGHSSAGGQVGIRKFVDNKTTTHNYCIDCLDHVHDFLEIEL